MFDIPGCCKALPHPHYSLSDCISASPANSVPADEDQTISKNSLSAAGKAVEARLMSVWSNAGHID